MVTAFTPATVETICGPYIYLSTTMVTCTGSTYSWTPRRRPIATLMVLSSMRRPREEMGSTFIQAPDSFALEAADEHEIWDQTHLREGDHPYSSCLDSIPHLLTAPGLSLRRSSIDTIRPLGFGNINMRDRRPLQGWRYDVMDQVR